MMFCGASSHKQNWKSKYSYSILFLKCCVLNKVSRVCFLRGRCLSFMKATISENMHVSEEIALRCFLNGAGRTLCSDSAF